MILTEYDLDAPDLQTQRSSTAPKFLSEDKTSTSPGSSVCLVPEQRGIGSKVKTPLSFRMERRSRGSCINFSLTFISEKIREIILLMQKSTSKRVTF